jgi:hypothetical protein
VPGGAKWAAALIGLGCESHKTKTGNVWHGIRLGAAVGEVEEVEAVERFAPDGAFFSTQSSRKEVVPEASNRSTRSTRTTTARSRAAWDPAASQHRASLREPAI